MKVELIRKGDRVEIAITVDGMSQSYLGGYPSQTTEELLVGEAERLYKQLGDAIKKARQLTRPKTKFGDH